MPERIGWKKGRTAYCKLEDGGELSVHKIGNRVSIDFCPGRQISRNVQPGGKEEITLSMRTVGSNKGTYTVSGWQRARHNSLYKSLENTGLRRMGGEMQFPAITPTWEHFRVLHDAVTEALELEEHPNLKSFEKFGEGELEALKGMIKEFLPEKSISYDKLDFKASGRLVPSK